MATTNYPMTGPKTYYGPAVQYVAPASASKAPKGSAGANRKTQTTFGLHPPPTNGVSLTPDNPGATPQDTSVADQGSGGGNSGVDWAAIEAARANVNAQYGVAQGQINTVNSDLMAQYAALQKQYYDRANAATAATTANYTGAANTTQAANAYLGNDLAQQGFSANPLQAQNAVQQATLGAQKTNQLGLANNLQNVYAQQASDRGRSAGIVHTAALNSLEMARLNILNQLSAAASGSGGRGGGGSGSANVTSGDAGLMGDYAMPLSDVTTGAAATLREPAGQALLDQALSGGNQFGHGQLGSVNASGSNAAAIQSRYLRAFDSLQKKGVIPNRVNRTHFAAALAQQTKQVKKNAAGFQKAYAQRQRAAAALTARGYQVPNQ